MAKNTFVLQKRSPIQFSPNNKFDWFQQLMRVINFKDHYIINQFKLNYRFSFFHKANPEVLPYGQKYVCFTKSRTISSLPYRKIWLGSAINESYQF